MLIIEHLRELSLAATSLSKVDNMFNSKSIFNTKCAKFSTKWQAYLYIQPPHNLHQKFVPSLQPTFTFPFHLPYTCSQNHPYGSHQYSLRLTQQFLSSHFLQTAIPTISSRSFFPTITIQPIQAASNDHRGNDFCKD